MNYQTFERSRDLAWEILLYQNVHALPVDVLEICRRLGIRVVRLRESCAEAGDGYSCMIEGVPYICLASNASRQRQRFTVAHELGHILLGHVGKYTPVRRAPLFWQDPIEQAANGFAAKLLAPACVLWGCGAVNATDIAALCDISMVSARFREKRLRLLMARGQICTNPLERQVYAQFLDFIGAYRNR